MVNLNLERARGILEATTDGYWEWNLETGHVHFSPGMLQNLGYLPDEVEPSITQWENWVHPEDVPRTRLALQEHFDHPERRFVLEYRVRASGGRWVWVKSRGKSVEWLPNGTPLRMVGTHEDINTIREQERKDREPELIAGNILRALTQTAVIAADIQGIITTFNPGAERILGMQAIQVIGRKRLEEIFANEEMKERSALLSSLIYNRLSGFALLQKLATHPLIASGVWTMLHAQGPRIKATLKLSRLADAGLVAIIDPIEDQAAPVNAGPENIRAGLDRALDAVAFVSPQGKVQYANPAFCDLFGFSLSEYHLPEVFRRMTQADFEQARQRMQQALENPAIPVRAVNRIRLDDGTWRWLDVVVTNLIHDPAIGNVVITARDITASIGMTKTVVMNEERFRLASQYTHIGVWDWNISTGNLYWSDEISKLFGYTDGFTETTYANFIAAVHPLDRSKLQHAVDEALAHDRPYEIQHRVVRPDGTVRWMQERGGVERDADGKPIRMLGAVWDVTELVEALARLADREEHFRALAENSSEAVLVTDPQRNIRFASQSLERVLGIRPETMLGRSVQDWLHPVDVKKVQSTIALLMRSPGISVKLDVRARADEKDEWRWFEGTITNLIENPSVNGFVINLRDITSKRRAVQELTQSEQRFRNLAEWAPVGIFQNMPDGNQIWSNQAWSQITGLSREQGLGHGWMKSMSADGLERIRTEIENLSDSSTSRAIEYEVERPDGTKLWVAGTAVPQFSADGQIQGYMGTLVDITEIKRLARLKDEFISTINHELRTPLTSIHGSLGLLLGNIMGELPGEIREVLAIAAKNTARLMRMVNDFLDMEKLETGTIALELEPIDLDRLVREAIVDSEGYASIYRIKVQLSSVEGRPWVQASHDRLSQVMANLLSNAIKFSPKWHPVEISVTQTEGRVRVTISDRGPGIPLEFRSRLFQRFAQADASDQRPREGTGLGLNISRAIIQLHGGRIGFDDRPGGGTSFYFELPVYSEDRK